MVEVAVEKIFDERREGEKWRETALWTSSFQSNTLTVAPSSSSRLGNR